MNKYKAIKFPILWLVYEAVCLGAVWIRNHYDVGVLGNLIHYLTLPFYTMVRFWGEDLSKMRLIDIQISFLPTDDLLIMASFIYFMMFFCLGFIFDLVVRFSR